LIDFGPTKANLNVHEVLRFDD